MNSIDKVLEIVKKIKSNELGIITGAKQLVEFRDYFIANPSGSKLSYDDLALFFSIEFEAKGLPVNGDERKNWGEEALKIKDEEIKKIEEKYSEQVSHLCEEIIKKLE